MSNMFFDIETIGIPCKNSYNKYYHPSNYEKYDYSRMIELAYIIDGDNILIKKEFLIKPDNFKVENSDIHGITMSMLEKEGSDMKNVLDELRDDLINFDVSTIISHNINFDYNILLSECYRYDRNNIIRLLVSKNKECTMTAGKLKFKLDKFPRLTELYEMVVGKNVLQSHRALSDAELCRAIYKLI